MSEKSYYDKIHENSKEYYFYTEIGRVPVLLKLDVGWVSIKKSAGRTGFFGVAGSEKFDGLSLTTKDARKLADCLNILLGDTLD